MAADRSPATSSEQRVRDFIKVWLDVFGKEPERVREHIVIVGAATVLRLSDLQALVSETKPLADLIPTTWLDPLLTGPSAALPPTGTIEPQHIEALLRRLKQRIQEAENG